ncbi:MAG: hypothetical protein DHS20C05_13970 [Hyphococcus sp.]|nr:MAG: hypothetical protein DHS20C05_13970 [Marinicaulis sp.]
MRTVAGLSAGTATYAYNADGTRRSRTYNSVTASFYYDGDQEIIEYQASSVERRYIRLPGSVLNCARIAQLGARSTCIGIH